MPPKTMNAQNIVYNLAVSTASPLTPTERQIAEHLVDTISSLSNCGKVYYEEETTLDLGNMSDEYDSEEEESAEDESTDVGSSEQADPNWENEEIALEKYNLKQYSVDLMRKVVAYADKRTNRVNVVAHGIPFIKGLEQSQTDIMSTDFDYIYSTMAQRNKKHRMWTS
ncbi:unnamed protein product [Didymodactylos carnosus]|uniref:Uncharacterized protein n=1 Tax=Didymodactylos carnosus TaxID=1234261 RepID=A0A8S2CTH0_9BILA|nr:unnamed protein product [Didymodactylos carnosus]CAF3582678.1 unnamed protein product [Didymodactylos carnosus]